MVFQMVLTAGFSGTSLSSMAIGVFITFRILDLADLTAEGAFHLVLLTTYHDYPWDQPNLCDSRWFVAGMLAGA